MTQRVDLKVGFRCNNFCDFCVQGDKRTRLPAKPLEELVDSLKAGRAAGACGVVVTGGEPTLYPRLLEVVRAARRLGYRQVQIQSNGRAFCYDTLCRQLIEAGVTEFSPSLHGSSEQIHDRQTLARGSFFQTVAGIRNLKRLGAKVITNSVITSGNFKDLPELARLLVSLGVDQFQLAFVHALGRAGENKKWLVPRKSQIMPLVKAALDIGREAGVLCYTEAIPYCLMKGYEDCVAERIIPETMIFDAKTVIPDYTRERREEGKAKGPACVRCRYDSVCEGPWREYPALFGWDEFVPAAP